MSRQATARISFYWSNRSARIQRGVGEIPHQNPSASASTGSGRLRNLRTLRGRPQHRHGIQRRHAHVIPIGRRNEAHRRLYRPMPRTGFFNVRQVQFTTINQPMFAHAGLSIGAVLEIARKPPRLTRFGGHKRTRY